MKKKMEQLRKPFNPDEVEFRIARSGTKPDGSVWATCFVYITNRAIMNRLDEVFGIMNWKNSFEEWRGTSQLCTISIYDEEKKEWISKTDGADDTNFEGTKGGLSDSMKRAGYQWGIGRYLYNSEEMFVNTSTKKVNSWGWNPARKDRNGNITTPAFWWEMPTIKYWEEHKKEFENDPADEIKSPDKQRKNYTELAHECKTVEELKIWFKSLTEAEQKEASRVVKDRKAELTKKPGLDVRIAQAKTEKEFLEISDFIDKNRDSIQNIGEIANLFNKKAVETGNGHLTILPF